MLIGNISVYYVKLKPSIAFLIFHTLFYYLLNYDRPMKFVYRRRGKKGMRKTAEGPHESIGNN
jgi:hypothetical protein